MTAESKSVTKPEKPAEPKKRHDDNVEQVEAYLFKEEDEVLKCIAKLNHESPTVSKDALDTIRSILDKYLECPTLLDSSLGLIVETLVLQVKLRLSEAQTETEITEQTGNYFVALYTVSKVRGYKRVNRFLSHQVDDIDLIWRSLTAWRNRHKTSNTHKDIAFENADALVHAPWEPLHVLWHWMGVLSLVPFSSRVVSGEEDILSTLIVTAQEDLEFASGPVQEAAATCLASWLSRPDAASKDNDVLQEFSSWAKGVMTEQKGRLQSIGRNNNAAKEGTERGSSVSKSTNLLLGTLQVVTKVLKHASVSRETLLEHLVEPLWDTLLLLDEHNDGNLLLRRYLVKWWTRSSYTYMGLYQLQPWRYQRGKRRLLDLQKGNTGEASSTPSNQPSNQNERSSSTAELHRAETQALIYVPDHVEDAMGRILDALGHSSTVVRWSAAKGVGRVTERLPEQCALDVLDAVLEYFDNPELDNCWHGACLALAEMARKGLLLPSSLPSVVPHVINAIQYDLRRGNTSVGSNVRDAACYSFWAFARSYSPTVLRDHLDKLAEAVVLTSLFDREVNCRRAASAAFQEAVGRQGMASFPNGIFVVTTADFFSLGNRSEAFTSVSAKIALLPEYRRPIIRHLYEDRLSHWDASIRGLAADALAKVASLDESFIGSTVIPFLLERSLDNQNLPARHGAVIGLAELVRVLGIDSKSLMSILSDTTMNRLVDLVNQIESRRLYRGRGGEIMRIAVCRFVECFALAEISLDVKNQVKILDAVDASIPHPNEEIQKCACRALHQLLTSYFPVGEKGPSTRLKARVLDKFVKIMKTTKNPAAARGYALALGHLPAKLIAPDAMSLESALQVLARAAHPKAKVDGEADAETRRNSTTALTQVVSVVARTAANAGHESKYPLEELTSTQITKVLKALLWGMEDYNVDRRGDVGSWVRVAAMNGFTKLILLCDEIGGKQLFESLSGTKIVGLLLKQLSEKLDSVRVQAGKNLQTILLRDDDSFPRILGAPRLRDALELRDCSITYGWAEPRAVFRRALAAAIIEGEEATSGDGPTYPYYGPTIAGIISSVGGKAESPEATSALLEHAKASKGTPLIPKLGKIMLLLFERHLGAGRVILPLQRTIEKLLSRQCLDQILDSDETFARPLFSLMDKELENCRDVHRLFALSDVAATMMSALPVSSGMKSTCVRFMCKMLEHEFPRVRARAAEVMYLAVEENEGSFPGHMTTVSTLLLETPWGNDFSDQEIASYSAEVLLALFPLST